MKKGWLDKYENGGEYLGTTNVGRNYSPAWGGQFQMGGYVYPTTFVPQAQNGLSFLPQQDPEMMYNDRYNTPLNKKEQKAFDEWVAEESKRRGRNILMDKGAYDVQGFWKSGDYKNMDEDNHGTDTWKKPNHPTFSNQSKYHGVDGFYGGNWTQEAGYQPSKQTMSLYDENYYKWMFGSEPNRPEHLDVNRFKSGVNKPSPLYYKMGGNVPKAQDGTFLLNLEDKINEKLRGPMDVGADLAYEATKKKGAKELDALRHAYSSMETNKKIQNLTGNIPIVSSALGAVGTNLLGIGHELSVLNFDDPHNLRESGEDIINNFVGSVAGSIPFVSDKKKREVIQYLSDKGILPDGTTAGKGRVYEVVNKNKKYAMGGSIPGSVGFTYARTGSTPSEGPYAKKTLPSAQNGQEMSFYQHGLDWTPRNISEYGSEIPMAKKGEDVPYWMKRSSDISQRGNQNLNTEIGVRKSKNKKAREEVEILKKAGYTEKDAKNAIKYNRTKGVDKIIKQTKQDEYNIKNHPDYNPDKSITEQKGLAYDNSLRTTLLRGANKLTNTGNDVTDFVTGMVTSPGRSFANLTTDAQKQYFNPENSVSENLTNLGLDLLEVAPTAVIGAASKVPQAARQAGKYLTTGPLKNAYKYNPWAFKANPEAGYRMIGGKEGYLDAITSGQIRPTGAYEHAHFNIGQPLNPNRLSAEELIQAGSPGGYKGPYMAEMQQGTWQRMSDAFPNNPEMQEQFRLLGKDKDVWQHPLFGNIKVDDVRLKLYKEDWLRGYKEVPKKEKGGVVKDNMGYWNPDNWGKVVEIDSPNITMRGVNQDLIGISDEGDVQYMEREKPGKPGKDYKFKGKKVKEYPVAKYGVNQQDEKTAQHLDQLLNFTNYNKLTKGGWLDKY